MTTIKQTIGDVRFTFRCWCIRTRERLAFKVAFALPAWLVYLCGIRLVAHASSGAHSHREVGSISGMDAIETWRKEKGAI